MPHILPALIFDLDGTLTDSMPGILGCLRKVLEARNMSPSGPLERFIGPPVEDWVKQLLPHAGDEERASLARDYRACYDQEGWRNNSVFPGVRQMLTQLHHQGFPLHVCTSKHRPYAMRILRFFKLEPFFASIYGDRPEYPTHAKADLLAMLLREQSLNPGAVWMIGDRVFDFQAARANHIRCLAVGWGYGAPSEHTLADVVAVAPADVPSLVAPQASAQPPSEEPRTIPA